MHRTDAAFHLQQRPRHGDKSGFDDARPRALSSTSTVCQPRLDAHKVSSSHRPTQSVNLASTRSRPSESVAPGADSPSGTNCSVFPTLRPSRRPMIGAIAPSHTVTVMWRFAGPGVALRRACSRAAWPGQRLTWRSRNVLLRLSLARNTRVGNRQQGLQRQHACDRIQLQRQRKC